VIKVKCYSWHNVVPFWDVERRLDIFPDAFVSSGEDADVNLLSVVANVVGFIQLVKGP